MTPPTSTPSEKDRVIIFDTTLRDGEQSPGASMTLPEKMQVAELLDEMGVDIIEAGFPIASNGDFESVLEIGKVIKRAVVCGLARAGNKDIDRAAEALIHAERKRIHTFISTSPLHMKFKLNMEPEAVYAAVISSVTRARNHTDDVEWSPEDGTRTEHDFLCRSVEAAIKAGATTDQHPRHGRLHRAGGIHRAHPHAARARAERRQGDLLDPLPQRPRPGGRQLALGVEGGARQIECTINGLGERAGNAALEEIVMAIKTRGDVLPYYTNIDSTMLLRASKLVSTVTAFPVQYNKAIVGKNAFAHEAGIHQDGMLKNAQTYEIMLPEDVGVKATSLVMGKHSGRHAFREKLKELGFELGDNAFEDAFKRFKDLADKKKHVFDEDIEALVEDEATIASESIRIVSLTVIAGTAGSAEGDADA